MYGRSYVPEYVATMHLKEQKDELLYDYITETLRMLNTAFSKRFGGNYIAKPYRELVGSHKKPDNRPADEIISEVNSKAGLEVTD